MLVILGYPMEDETTEYLIKPAQEISTPLLIGAVAHSEEGVAPQEECARAIALAQQHWSRGDVIVVMNERDEITTKLKHPQEKHGFDARSRLRST